MHRVMIFAHPGSQATRATHSNSVFTFWPMADVLLASKIYSTKPIFPITVSSMCRGNIHYVWYLSLAGLFWTAICLLINLGAVNQRISHFFSKIHKSIIRLEEIFQLHICIHFSTSYEQSKHLDGPPGCPPCTIQKKLGLSPTITPQGIAISHCPPVSVMISNNIMILKAIYLPIHHSSFLFPTLRHRQTWGGWYHHYIIIRFLHKKDIKLCIIAFTTNTYHITNTPPPRCNC